MLPPKKKTDVMSFHRSKKLAKMVLKIYFGDNNLSHNNKKRKIFETDTR